MSAQQLDMFGTPAAQVRGVDPRTSREAAASAEVEKQRQWKLILERLHEGPCSADTAGVLIGRHRSIASSRLGVMMRRGLVEPAGEFPECPVDGGRERKVLRYRLTGAGRREFGRLFGGWSQ